MKYIITESQLEIIKDSILKIPFSLFNNNWNLLQKVLNKRGNPPYILKGKVDLSHNEQITTLGSLISVEGNLNIWGSSIESLGNLISVDGDFTLDVTPIESLGNLTLVGGDLSAWKSKIKSLGNLTSVGKDLDLRYTPIESFGNLKSVGGDLYLEETPISKDYPLQDIAYKVEVEGEIYL
jgi:hypothetical protein